MKIQLVNSPFDFDEVGSKTANRWAGQNKADWLPDGRLRIRDTFTLAVQTIIREDERYDEAMRHERGGEMFGEWIPAHSGAVPYGGVGPESKVLQYMPTVHKETE